MNVFFFVLYEIALWLLAILALPKTLYSFFVHKKYRKSLLARFGFSFPINSIDSHPSIWIHAVSVGETKAVVSLARELKSRFPRNPLIISSVTETGHAEALRSLPFADYHVYFPLDFFFVISRLIKKASPGLVILCESDFWYNFLYCSKRQGAVLALVNGKMSDRSMHRFRFFHFFSKRLFGLFDLLCLQNVLYSNRFKEAGADSKKIIVTGNLKFDEEYPQLSQQKTNQWRQKLGIQPDQMVLTIGSTHFPEEKMLLDVLKKIWDQYPNLRVIIVPRHPERFKEVGQLLERERVSWINFSDIAQRTGREQVILVNAMGLLRMCYQLTDLAIVGGSFTEKVGGHNILEPCWYGKPVLFGPYMHAQLELVNLMTDYQAGVQTDLKELQLMLQNWITHPEKRKKIGANGLLLIKDLRGSTKHILNALDPFIGAFK